MPIMNMLSKDEIDIRPHPDGKHVYISLFEYDRNRHYEMIPKSNLPNDFISADDLERFEITE